MKVLVSKCLLGVNCKYNGGNNKNEKVIEFLKDKEYVSICPEILAIKEIPRTSVEILNGKIIDKNGKDVDEIYRQGCKLAMEKIESQDFELAILQSRSPTCGVGQIYDGTFSKKLIEGNGIFAEALKQRGIKIINVEDFEELF